MSTHETTEAQLLRRSVGREVYRRIYQPGTRWQKVTAWAIRRWFGLPEEKEIFEKLRKGEKHNDIFKI